MNPPHTPGPRPDTVPPVPAPLRHPEWSRSAVLYQINTRQFTAEGTFAAAAGELPRLADLGVGILWLMPIHEIGWKHRKGRLGSPYAVRDHLGVNPEFGDLDDLRAFVDRAHDLGLRVILDWVANHTAWDHPLVESHPEWFARDWKGDFRPTPWWDWTDVIDLDWSRPGVWDYMAEAMAYWVREADVDGFRCDVAGFVPLEFWERVRDELDALKPVFMLAEWETRDLHRRAFDATYAWRWYDAMHDIALGRADVERLYEYYSGNERAYPPGAMRMHFVENHDKNAWNGTAAEQFGDALEAAVVLSVVSEGIPLIHNGQEAGNPKRLDFFDRDPIEWRPHAMGDLYRRLLGLKRRTPALWNPGWGGRMIRIPNGDPAAVLSFTRAVEGSRVVGVFNLSGRDREVVLGHGPQAGTYRRVLAGAEEASVGLAPGTRLAVEAWGWRVFEGVSTPAP